MVDIIHYKYGKPAFVWAYHTPEGQIIGYDCRFNFSDESKIVLPYFNGEWKAPPVPRPLYGLHRLAQRKNDPVLIVEGAKTAEAAEGLFLSHIAITSIGGAGNAAHSDWRPLADREVVIWPDADEVGLKYANEVAQLAFETGAKSVSIVDVEGLPKKWDLADEVPQGVDIEAMLKAAKPVEVIDTAAPHYISFGEFEMSEAGLTIEVETGRGQNKTTESKWICRAFEVIGRARDPNGEGWAKYLQWRDDDGRLHTHSILDADLHGDLKALCGGLANKGLIIAIGCQGYIARYLNAVRVETKVTVVNRTGWHDIAGSKVFVLPNSGIGTPDQEQVIFNGGGASPYEIKGTLEDWKAGVGNLVAGHARPVLAVSMAFAGVLLSVVGVDGGGVNLFGQSSRGKSTCGEAAASVWGKGASPGFVRSWRSTANALEGAAVISSDTLLVLDELGVVDAKEAAAGVYQLANGTGKGRSSRDGSLRTSMTWRVLLLSTGETSMADKITENKWQKAHAGQQVRLLDIPADAGFGFGAFDNKGAFDDAGKLSDAIKQAARNAYGTAGSAFVRRIIHEGFSDVGKAVTEMVEAFKAAHVPQGADGQVHRAAARLGLIASAGELATLWGITPWQAGESTQAAVRALNDWITQRGGVEAAEVGDAITQVRKFIEANGEARFEPTEGNTERAVINRAGWRRGIGEEREWLILPEAWKEICAGFNSTQTAKALAEKGMLTRGNDGRYSRPEYTSMGSKRVYVLTNSILEGGE